MKTRGSEIGIVGLDLSLRAPAALYIPPGWDGEDLSVIKISTLGSETRAKTPADEEGQLIRMAEIAEHTVRFIRERKARAAYVEGYAYSAGGAGAHRLAELGGIVRHEVMKETGIVLEAVPSASARKTLLQKLPRAEVKKFVERNVRRLKTETYYWTGDVIDAFVCANHGRFLRGLVHMSFLGV